MGPPRSTSTVTTALRQDVAAVARQLLRRGETLALAESCTGGLLAAALTAAPGSSAFFLGAVVCYSNASKRQLLGVSPASLRRYGAVSAPVASALASGARLRFGADWSLAITGIAGPSGGSASKPVGTVCVAMAGPLGRPRVSVHHFTGNRSQIRRQSVRAALVLLSEATRSPSPRSGAV